MVFDFFSNYLIEFMGSMLIIGLGFRWASWRSSKREDAYFTGFTSEIEKTILLQKDLTHEQVEDVDKYLAELLETVSEKLPTRSLRNKSQSKSNQKTAEKMGAQNVVSLREYVKGDQSLFLGIKNESASFKSKFPPNFNELTDRILEKDDNWNKLLNFFPIGPISRLIDILPGLFVVFGIFGTFIGISMALPKIAEMDFNNLEASGAILTQFVLSVTYAMKTSIAGILFSVVMTLLNTIAPVTGMRNRTYKKISNCFENIWHSIHGEKSLEEEMHEVLPALLEEVKALRKAAEGKQENEEEEFKQKEGA
tara:strand:+ start:39841 stop:40767 length:927 start_codon:yes stop_codon:yes gene_type:complete